MYYKRYYTGVDVKLWRILITLLLVAPRGWSHQPLLPPSLASSAVIVCIVVGQHLFLNIIPNNFAAGTGPKVWCEWSTSDYLRSTDTDSRRWMTRHYSCCCTTSLSLSLPSLHTGPASRGQPTRPMRGPPGNGDGHPSQDRTSPRSPRLDGRPSVATLSLLSPTGQLVWTRLKVVVVVLLQ